MNKSEIIAMFKKRPLPPGQINLYKVLYEAGRSMTLQEIADAMREGDVDSLNMLLVALAKRITDRKSDWKRDDVLSELFYVMLPDSDNTSYRMRLPLKDAIEQCSELLEIINNKAVQQIYEDYGRFPMDSSKYLTVDC